MGFPAPIVDVATPGINPHEGAIAIRGNRPSPEPDVTAPAGCAAGGFREFVTGQSAGTACGLTVEVDCHIDTTTFMGPARPLPAQMRLRTTPLRFNRGRYWHSNPFWHSKCLAVLPFFLASMEHVQCDLTGFNMPKFMVIASLSSSFRTFYLVPQPIINHVTAINSKWVNNYIRYRH